MKLVKRGFNFLVVAIAFLSLTLPFGTTTFAAENHSVVCNDLHHDEHLDESIVIARAAICPLCHEGYLLKSTTTTGPYFEGSSICSYRPDCMVTLYRYNHTEHTSCSECSYGYDVTLNPTYSSQHSKYHL